MVLTSDSRESSTDEGRVAGTTQKIYVARPGFLFAWSGYKYVAQAFLLAIRDAKGLSPRSPRAEVERQLFGLLKQLQAEGKTDAGEWIIAWWCFPENAPVALQI